MEKKGGGMTGVGSSTSRGSLRPYGATSRSHSFVVIGLIVVIAILGFNYYNAMKRNNQLAMDIITTKSLLKSRQTEKEQAENSLKMKEMQFVEAKQAHTDTKQQLEKMNSEIRELHNNLQNCQQQTTNEKENCREKLSAEKENCLKAVSGEKDESKKLLDSTIKECNERLASNGAEVEQECKQQMEQVCDKRVLEMQEVFKQRQQEQLQQQQQQQLQQQKLEQQLQQQQSQQQKSQLKDDAIPQHQSQHLQENPASGNQFHQQQGQEAAVLNLNRLPSNAIDRAQILLNRQVEVQSENMASKTNESQQQQPVASESTVKTEESVEHGESVERGRLPYQPVKTGEDIAQLQPVESGNEPINTGGIMKAANAGTNDLDTQKRNEGMAASRDGNNIDEEVNGQQKNANYNYPGAAANVNSNVYEFNKNTGETVNSERRGPEEGRRQNKTAASVAENFDETAKDGDADNQGNNAYAKQLNANNEDNKMLKEEDDRLDAADDEEKDGANSENDRNKQNAAENERYPGGNVMAIPLPVIDKGGIVNVGDARVRGGASGADV